MANFQGYARSNYLHWDQNKLDALQTLFEFEVANAPNGTQALLSQDPQGTPSCWREPDEPEFLDSLEVLGLDPHDSLEFLDVVHLAFDQDATEDSLFVWIEIGNEKLRYLHGCATSIDLTGEIVNQINLQNIYTIPNMTMAEY